MNYIGSKASLLEFLASSITQVAGHNKGTFCDLFAGTGCVGSYFKKQGYRIIANDLQYYSYVLNRHYIGNQQILPFTALRQTLPALQALSEPERSAYICAYLTNLAGTKGFIYTHYCPGGTQNTTEPRQYFSDENGQQCDAIRQQIEAWRTQHLITEDEYFFLLASLLESIDKYANTASVYGAFLKQVKKSAQKKLVLKPAELFFSQQAHQVYQQDINTLLPQITGDILYLDPPYNQRQYATNYHLLETIARYDQPVLHGKTGLREYQAQKSLYCSKTQVQQAFRNLILQAQVKYIFLSYNNEGLLSLADIQASMSLRGQYGVFTKEYNRFKADKTTNRPFKAAKTTEYLHYVITTPK